MLLLFVVELLVLQLLLLLLKLLIVEEGPTREIDSAGEGNGEEKVSWNGVFLDFFLEVLDKLVLGVDDRVGGFHLERSVLQVEDDLSVAGEEGVYLDSDCGFLDSEMDSFETVPDGLSVDPIDDEEYEGDQRVDDSLEESLFFESLLHLDELEN